MSIMPGIAFSCGVHGSSFRPDYNLAMQIPDYESLMPRLLRVMSDGESRSLKQLRDLLAVELGLDAEATAALLPSGSMPVWASRVGWAKTYLKQAGLLEPVSRGVVRITPRGQALLRESPSRIDAALLRRYPEFEAFRTRRRDSGEAEGNGAGSEGDSQSRTPTEILERAYEQMRDAVAEELLDQVRSASPAFFERLVVELLLKMGYGGSRREAGKALGRSGDEGIDGTIYEDRLGLDIVYIQAKRWEGTVGRPEVQKFVGALHGQRARKGVFITTGRFSNDARAYVGHIDPKVVLIDGEELSSLMLDFNVGVTSVATYEIKRVDSDYFVEE